MTLIRPKIQNLAKRNTGSKLLNSDEKAISTNLKKKKTKLPSRSYKRYKDQLENFTDEIH